MNKTGFVSLALGLGIETAVYGAVQPNIVVILVDDMG